MKIAILGHSPIALEAALKFHHLGAALTWYMEDNHYAHFRTCEDIVGSFISEEGLSILKSLNLNINSKILTWSDWSSFYEKPLVDYLRQYQEIKTDEVVSVTKRYLAPHEVIKNRSRLHDLFRVIYKIDPREFIEEQKEVSPETYEKLTEEFVNSLASSIEMYQDYDLIFDFRSDLMKASVASSGRALGEGRLSDKVFYGHNALSKTEDNKALQETREIALVSSGPLAAEIICSLELWIEDPRNRLFVISDEEDPFSAYIEKASIQSMKKLTNIFMKLDAEFSKEIEVFSQKLREWQELDDFVQVKIPKPLEPIPRLVYFSGHTVTAIDELIDRKRMFLTLEKPDFRHGIKQPENNHLELKTIGVDLVFVSHAKKDKSILSLDENEVGYFDLTPVKPNLANAWETDNLKLKGAFDEVFKFFSPSDSH